MGGVLMGNVSFYKFMTDNYIKEDSPAGDLARDIKSDRDFPKRSIKYSHIFDHLLENGACNDCITTFEDCWKEYKAWRDQY